MSELPPVMKPDWVLALGELEDYVRENEGSITEIGHGEAIRRLITENRELNISAQLRWDADMRAIGRWQAEHPDRELIWPDHVDLVIWLMGKLFEGRG